ncbi:MAG: Gfo/Idh/MocA family oxidoreductase [Spirochaetia bacterium]
MKKRYAVVGTGSRSYMYINALCGEYTDYSELTAFCDINQTRMDYANENIGKKYGHKPVPTYKPHDFEKMISDNKCDTVIVTSMDRTHHDYIVRGMKSGCDMITEKPMTVDEEKAQAIIDTVKETGKNLTVTFNYRYSPRNTKVKELIMKGEIGNVLSIHFEWLLDTKHGTDYFRRWHRDKVNSGGLLVHKATHHFDLVNWWVDTFPKTVFAFGKLAFYGRQNAEQRGVEQFYDRALDSEIAKDDPFAIDLRADENLRRLYLEAEHEDGYIRDKSVFGYNISIEDTMGVLVRYQNDAIMSYSLNAHCPWEGYRVMFNGTKGRLELNVKENSYVSGSADDINLTENRSKDDIVETEVPQIILQKHWDKPREIKYEAAVGGHGGGDTRLLNHVFLGVKDDPYGHAAGYRDGAMSILTGIAANKSIASGEPVKIADLIKF